jgi:hypothetical protein
MKGEIPIVYKLFLFWYVDLLHLIRTDLVMMGFVLGPE